MLVPEDKVRVVSERVPAVGAEEPRADELPEKEARTCDAGGGAAAIGEEPVELQFSGAGNSGDQVQDCSNGLES